MDAISREAFELMHTNRSFLEGDVPTVFWYCKLHKLTFRYIKICERWSVLTSPQRNAVRSRTLL